MDLQVGHDGQYAICFKSIRTPDRMEEIKKFRPYGLSVRVDSERCWVFLRSPNLKDINRCISELGDIYRFQQVINTRKHQEPIEDTSLDVIRVYETVFMNLPPTLSAGRVKELCGTIGVMPVETCKHYTEKLNTPYFSVYVRSKEDVNALCRQLNGSMCDGKHIIVKDANDLL